MSLLCSHSAARGVHLPPSITSFVYSLGALHSICICLFMCASPHRSRMDAGAGRLRICPEHGGIKLPMRSAETEKLFCSMVLSEGSTDVLGVCIGDESRFAGEMKK
jgi:hypothetical protein